MPDYYEELENELTKAEADLALATEERDALWAQRARLTLQKARLLDALEKMRAHGRRRQLGQRLRRAMFQSHEERVRIAGLATQHVQELAYQRDGLVAERNSLAKELALAKQEARQLGDVSEGVLKATEAQRDEFRKQRDEAEQRIRDLTAQRDKYLEENIMLRSEANHLQDANTYMADRLKAIRQALGGYSDSDLVSLATTMRARLTHLLNAIHGEDDDGHE